MASGDSLVLFYPLNTTRVTSGATATLLIRNNRPVLRYTSNVQLYTLFSGVMPQHYGGGGIDVKIHYTSNTSTGGYVTWGGQFRRIGDQQYDLDSTIGWDTTQTASDTPGTADFVNIANLDFLNNAEIDDIVAGESFDFLLYRFGDTDTSTNDTDVLFLELREA